MRIATFMIGVVLAAVGGTLLYRALFLDRGAAFIVTDAGAVREVPDTLRIAVGAALLIIGACIAFFGARRRRS